LSNQQTEIDASDAEMASQTGTPKSSEEHSTLCKVNSGVQCSRMDNHFSLVIQLATFFIKFTILHEWLLLHYFKCVNLFYLSSHQCPMEE